MTWLTCCICYATISCALQIFFAGSAVQFGESGGKFRTECKSSVCHDMLLVHNEYGHKICSTFTYCWCCLQWARAVSPVKLLNIEDAVFEWREHMFSRYHSCVFESIGYEYK